MTLLKTEYNEHGRRKFKLLDANNNLADGYTDRCNRDMRILGEREQVRVLLTIASHQNKLNIRR